MLIKALKGKIHRATVTGSVVDYPGSIGIDTDLLAAAGILVYEHVLLVNVTNGARVDTYVVPADAGCGEVPVLGAAGRRLSAGDIVIIMNFALYTEYEMAKQKLQVVITDEKSKVTELL